MWAGLWTWDVVPLLWGNLPKYKDLANIRGTRNRGYLSPNPVIHPEDGQTWIVLCIAMAHQIEKPT